MHSLRCSAFHLWFDLAKPAVTAVRSVVMGVAFALTLTTAFLLIPQPAQAQYHPADAETLEADIDLFKGGSSMYIIWQFSGDVTSPTGNDPWSYFRGDPLWDEEVCPMLKEKSGEIRIGVNMWDVGLYNPDQFFSYLHESCGVTIVRVFARAGEEAGMIKVLNAAQAAGIQVIVAIGDFANAGGGFSSPSHESARAFYTMFSSGTYQSSEYWDFAQRIGNTVAPYSSSSLYGVELANEPHCFDLADLIDDYTRWVDISSSMLRGKGIQRVGVGQAANIAASSCDGPANGLLETNSPAGITMISGHHYNPSEVQVNLQGMQISTKEWYVGEANLQGEERQIPVEGEGAAQAPYYIYPIHMLDPAKNEGDVAVQAQRLQDELIDHGYEIKCSSPPIWYEGEFIGLEAYHEYFGDGVWPPPYRNLESHQDYVISEAQYPLFRSEQKELSEIKLNNSIETHFGYFNPDGELEDPVFRDVMTAPLYRRLTLQQQCEYQIHMLETIDTMCNLLEKPETCALYRPIVEDNDYTTETLFEAVDGMSCEELTDAQFRSYEGNADLVEALNNLPLYLNRAFRLAFILFSIELQPDIDLPDNPWGWDFLTTFEREENPDAKPKDEVRIVAFKIPDIGTNKPFTEEDVASGESGTEALGEYDFHYYDPLEITRDTITRDTTLINQRHLNFLAKKEDFKEAAEEFNGKFENEEGNPINCAGELCEDPLGRALVNMSNAYLDSEDGDKECKWFKDNAEYYEEAEEIEHNVSFSEGNIPNAGGIAGSIGTLFKDNFQLLTNIFKIEPYNQAPEKTKFNFLSDFDAEKYETATVQQVPSRSKTLLIYPVGYELRTVEEALIGYVTKQDPERTKAFFENTEENEPFFKITDIAQDFQSEVGSYQYFVEPGTPAMGGFPECPNYQNPTTGEDPKPCARYVWYKNADLSASATRWDAYQGMMAFDNHYDQAADEDNWPRIHGGYLGHVMRQLQLTARLENSPGWLWIKGCKNTEEFLLGTCNAEPAREDEEGETELAEACEAEYGDKNVTIYDEEGTYQAVVEVANMFHYGDQLFAQLLWGILQIEGAPYLQEMRTLNNGQTSSVACSEMINSCGAVGPLQIIQGVCVTDACSSSEKDELKEYDRDVDACDLRASLMWTAQNLVNAEDPSLPPDERYAAMAGAHGGFGQCANGAGADISGCNGLNYCDCASSGFSDDFGELIQKYGYVENVQPNQDGDLTPVPDDFLDTEN